MLCQAVEFWGDAETCDGLKLQINPLAGLAAFTAEIVFMPYAGGPHEQRFFHMEDEESSGNRVLLETRNGGFSPPDEPAWAAHQATVPDGEWFLDACLQSGSATEGERNLAIQFATNCTHPAESWHTASVVVDGGQFTHYVDGIAEVSPKVPHASHELPSEWLPLGQGSMSLGMRINNVSWFRGAIRAIRFTPRALTPAELLPPTPDWVPPSPSATVGASISSSTTIKELLRDNVASWCEISPLLRHLIQKMIVLPRQARDNPMDNSKKRCVFRRNVGDLDGFMAGYWESEDLVFTSGGNVRRGYAATAAGYRTSYGTDDGGVDTVSER